MRKLMDQIWRENIGGVKEFFYKPCPPTKKIWNGAEFSLVGSDVYSGRENKFISSNLQHKLH